MNGAYRRRDVLAGAVAGAVGLAGCSGGDDTEPTSTPADDTGGDASGDGDGGTPTDTTTGSDSGALYADDHLEISETDDGYHLTVSDWPDDYVGTAEHRYVEPHDSTSFRPAMYDESGGGGMTVTAPHQLIVTPGFHADSFVAPFVWGDTWFEEGTPRLTVTDIPQGENYRGGDTVFSAQLPADTRRSIEEAPFVVANIDPIQLGWTNDTEPGEKIWVEIEGSRDNRIVDLTYTWPGETPTAVPVGEGVPPEDADPADLLPDVPDGWEQTGNGPVASAGPIEAGHWGGYTDPAGVQYHVEIARFESADAAASAPSEWNLYDDKPVYVTRGNFGFAGGGVTTGGEVAVDKVVTLLGHSPALTEEYVRNNNMNQ